MDNLWIIMMISAGRFDVVRVVASFHIAFDGTLFPHCCLLKSVASARPTGLVLDGAKQSLAAKRLTEAHLLSLSLTNHMHI